MSNPVLYQVYYYAETNILHAAIRVLGLSHHFLRSVVFFLKMYNNLMM